MKKTLLFITTASLALLPGGLPARAQKDGAPKLELGIQFSSLNISEPGGVFAGSGARTEAGFGVRVTYNLTDHFAVEGEGNLFPRFGGGEVARGRALQGQYGFKVGKRFAKFGVFAKARPGVVAFSDSITYDENNTFADAAGSRFFVPRSQTRHFFSADLGGVLEFYPSRRLVTRFDFGDTIIRYGPRNSPAFDFIPPDRFQERLVRLPAETRHNFQLSAGVGFRF